MVARRGEGGGGGRVHPSVTHIPPDLHSCGVAGGTEMRKTARSLILCGEAIFEENRTSLEFQFFSPPPSPTPGYHGYKDPRG